MNVEEPAVQSDTYIDALLGGHARLPIRIPGPDEAPEPGVRHIIRVLESGLPRFHPSFLFEERLAGQLRAAAEAAASGQVVLDRRLVVGGALASGLSIGAAAMLAWRRRQGP
jgi:hypothetical protein